MWLPVEVSSVLQLGPGALARESTWEELAYEWDLNPLQLGPGALARESLRAR